MAGSPRRNALFGVVSETCGLRRLDGGGARAQTGDPPPSHRTGLRRRAGNGNLRCRDGLAKADLSPRGDQSRDAQECKKPPFRRNKCEKACGSLSPTTGWWRWYGSNWLPPTQSYRTASLPPAWIAVISLSLRAACGRYLGPNVHRARRHEEDAAPSRHRSLSPNESAGRPSVMNSTAATAPSSQAASREPRI